METGAAGIQWRWNLSSILKHRSCIWFTNEGNVIFLFMYFCLGWFSFFTCQFFCKPLEALVLGDISLFIYTLWNSYVTNTTIFWMLQFFLQDKKKLVICRVSQCMSHDARKEQFCLLGDKRTCLVAKCKLYISENKVH